MEPNEDVPPVAAAIFGGLLLLLGLGCAMVFAAIALLQREHFEAVVLGIVLSIAGIAAALYGLRVVNKCSEELRASGINPGAWFLISVFGMSAAGAVALFVLQPTKRYEARLFFAVVIAAVFFAGWFFS